MTSRVVETAERSSEWMRGWRVLLASAVGVGVGIPAFINSAGLFVIPMQREFGWSRTALAAGPIVALLYALLNPLGGLIIDRYGARRLAIAGLALLALATSLLAAVPSSALPFYALLVLLSLVGTITNNVIYCKAVATWFHRYAGTAIALTLSGVSLVGAALQPILASIIQDHGWRTGYLVLAAVTLILGLPFVTLWFREQETRPGAYQVRSIKHPAEESAKHAFRDRRFWLILAAFAGAAMPIGGFVSQLQPLLVNKGYAPITAASLMTVFLVATAGGRFMAGVMFDHLRPSFVAAGFLLLSALGALILGWTATAPSWVLVATAVALIGLAQGAEGDFLALFALRIFGTKNFSTLFATLATAAGIAFAAGGFLFTAVFDQIGSYNPAVLGSALVLAASAAIAATIRLPRPDSYQI